MTSEIRANTIKNRVGLGTVSFTNTGPVVSGIVTATTADINGDLDVDGHTNLDKVSIAGVTTTSGLLDINAGGQANTFKVEDLTSGRVVLAGTNGELEDSSKLTFDGTTLQIENSLSGLRNLLRLKNSNASAGVSGLFFNSTTSGTAFDAACVRNGVNGSGQGRLFLQTNNGSGLVTNLSIEYDGQVSIPTNSLNINDSIVHIDDTNTKIRFPSNDTITFETAGNERLRITSSGDIGIGTDNPAVKLDVRGHIKVDDGPVLENSASGDVLKISNSTGYLDVGSKNTSYVHFTTDRPRFYFGRRIVVDEGIFASYNEDLVLATDITEERIRIKNDTGNVGIGSADPGGVLDLYHATSNTILNVKSGDAGSVINLIDNATRSSIEQHGISLKIISDTVGTYANSDIRLQVDGSTVMMLDHDGYVGINQTSPTAELEVAPKGTATTSTIFIHAPTHNTNAASEAILKFGYGHSGSPDAVGHIKMVENANNSFDGDLKIALPFNNGSGGSVTTERIHLDGTYGRLGLNTTSFSDTATALSLRNGRSDADHTILDIICNDNQTCRLTFSEDSNSSKGSIRYYYTGDGNYMSFYTNGGASGDERLRITSGGEVNIGGNYTQTTVPFSVTTGANDYGMRLLTGSNKVVLDMLNNDSSGNCEIRGYYNNNSGTRGEGFRLESNGNTFFSPAGSNRTFTVTNAKVGVSENELYVTSSASYATHINYQNNGSHYISIANGGAVNFRNSSPGGTLMRIMGTGSIGGGGSTTNIYNPSDERLKENMVELTDGLNKIKKLKPYSFTWKKGFDENLDGITQYGFGAHQAKTVDEKLVEKFIECDIELNGETIKDPLRVNEKHVIPLLVKAIQEQQEQIENLKSEVDALKG